MGSRFGLWGRFPMVMGGGKPRAQGIYESMRGARGEGHYSVNDDDMVNVDLQASAHIIDCAVAAQERAMYNGFPELSTDFLPDWERALGRNPDPSETKGQRRQTLAGILAGNGEPTEELILNALAQILPDETITIAPALAQTKTFVNTIAIDGPVLDQREAGNLLAGRHYIEVCYEYADGTMDFNLPAGINSIVLSAAGKSVGVGEFPLVNCPSGDAEMVHIYMSVAPGSQLCSYVATTRGQAVRIGNYPVTPTRELPLYHLGIVVSNTVFDDVIVRAKIDEILGPMLSGWTTYSVITGTPFETWSSGTGHSELGRSGL